MFTTTRLLNDPCAAQSQSGGGRNTAKEEFLGLVALSLSKTSRYRFIYNPPIDTGNVWSSQSSDGYIKNVQVFASIFQMGSKFMKQV